MNPINIRAQLSRYNLLDADGVFSIDNSSLQRFAVCPRQGFYAICLRRIVPASWALQFGAAIHLCLKMFYQSGGKTSKTLIWQQQKLLADFWKQNPPDAYADHRGSLEYAQRFIAEYCKSDDIAPITYQDKPCVETPFSVYLGEVAGIPVVWKGRIDFVGQDEQGLFIMDHKTSSMAGKNIHAEFQNSRALKGYLFSASRIMGTNILTAKLNLLVARAETKTGKGIEFPRFRFDYDLDSIAEFQHDTLQLVAEFFSALDNDHFRHNSEACSAKYGVCDYFDTCVLPPTYRARSIFSTAYKQNVWDPLHDDELDVTKYLQMVPDEIDTPQFLTPELRLEDLLK